MNKIQIIPNKFKICSGSTLKLIAVVTMLIDHIAAHLMTENTVTFAVGGITLSLYVIMRRIGRVAFPLFVFLLTEGFVHTHNRLKYGGSLLVCAIVSEFPWDLIHSGQLIYKGQNVFFTLLLGFLGMCAAEMWGDKHLIPLLALVGLAVLSVVAEADYGLNGYVFIILMYALRENELFRPFIAFLFGRCWYVMAAFIPIMLYNGKRGFIRGPVLKYAFYAFYPVHLFILYLFEYRIISF